MAFIFLLPITLVTEGIALTPARIASMGLNPAIILKKGNNYEMSIMEKI